MEITFDASDQHFVSEAPDGKADRKTARGISVKELMGEMSALVHLKEFKLSLPFSWDE